MPPAGYTLPIGGVITKHANILAWGHLIVSGGLLILGFGTLMVGALTPSTTAYAMKFIFGFFFWVSVMLLIPSFAGGLGVVRGHAWGRALLILVSVELLLLIPVGTAVGIYGLWALLSKPTGALPAPAFPPQAPPANSTVCPHLRPIEAAMLAAGIAMKPAYGHRLAQCRIHQPSLLREFAPLAPVRYSEFFQPERAAEDNPTARLYCTACSSWLDTLHPLQTNLQTPWWPAAPAPLVLLADRTTPIPGIVTAIAASPSGRLAAVAYGAHNTTPELVIWKGGTEPLLRIAAPCLVRSLSWSPDERFLVAARGLPWTGGPGSPGACLFVLDAQTGAELLRFGGELYGVSGVSVSPDGRHLLASGMLGETRRHGSTLDLWDIASGRKISQLARIEAAPEARIPYFTGTAFSPDGTLAIAGCGRTTQLQGTIADHDAKTPWWWWRGVRAWQLPDGREVDLIRDSSAVAHVQITDDGRRLFAAGDRLGLWNLSDGARLWDHPSYEGYPAAVSPDGRLVARGIGYRQDNHGPFVDTAVEIYDAASGEFLTTGPHQTPPTALAFLPANGGLLAGAYNGELRLWNCGGRLG
jgi:hypothetical protein